MLRIPRFVNLHFCGVFGPLAHSPSGSSLARMLVAYIRGSINDQWTMKYRLQSDLEPFMVDADPECNAAKGDMGDKMEEDEDTVADT